MISSLNNSMTRFASGAIFKRYCAMTPARAVSTSLLCAATFTSLAPRVSRMIPICSIAAIRRLASFDFHIAASSAISRSPGLVP